MNFRRHPNCTQGTDPRNPRAVQCAHPAPAQDPRAPWRYAGRHRIDYGLPHPRGPSPLQRFVSMVDDAWTWLNHPAQGPLEWHVVFNEGSRLSVRRVEPAYWLGPGDLANAARVRSWFPAGLENPTAPDLR